MGLLELAIVALVISVLAGAFGFTGVAKGASSIAKIAFGIFLLTAIILFALIALGVSFAL